MSVSGAPDEDRRRLITWLWRLPVLAVLGGAGYGLYEAINVHFLKRSPARDPAFEDAPAVDVGRLDAFVDTWHSIEFTLTTADTAVPAVALRVPGPVRGGLDVAALNLIAFSRICTHQHCIVSLNTDVDAITFGFNYDTDSPALTCPCHLSVFDPQRAGRAVSGPANLPLPRVRLALRGDMVVATGLETA
jgi:Rieske Fe-S protein